MQELDATMVANFVVTWSIGLLPPVIIRYAILRRPIAKWPAIGTCAAFLIINLTLFIAMGSQSKTHIVPALIAFISYSIFRQGAAKMSERPTSDAGDASSIKQARRSKESWWRRKSKHFRVWVFGSSLWVVSVLLFVVAFDPYQLGSWRYISDEELSHMMFVMFVPPLSFGIAKYAYDRWIR